ncbi:MAG TPA: hypothetical protein VND90_07445 [Terracidiphilus sp.]|nr:hypothetical protein [Terracidiphilus sp.]
MLNQSLTRSLLVAALASAALATAQQPAQPVALTIYNQDFAVARTSIDLNLHPGVNEITTTQVTSRLEPDSVILRDPSGLHPVHILEQNYDAAIVTQDWLLKKYEGKTIDFEVHTAQGTQIIPGKIIRAPSQPQPQYNFNGAGYQSQYAEPLVEVNGHMQFSLPGLPLFPASTDGLLLKPTLRWQIESAQPEHFSAELAYITGGLNWEATYNVVAPNATDVTGPQKADVLGWVTIHNLSGTDFPQARIKLMAGDVAKLQPQVFAGNAGGGLYAMAKAADSFAPQVTQKAFDDFHLYDLHRTVSLHDGETKQVQFLDASGVTIHRSYLYDGAASNLQPYYGSGINNNQEYGLDNGNTKVYIVQEIKNSKANHLGIPLPAGRMRLYRRDADGQMEFVGESLIPHTPTEDTVKLVSGSAFDVKGSRRQTDFHSDYQNRNLDESFEIKLTNQKLQPIQVTVLEHLYRGDNWQITQHSANFTQRDSRTVAFPIDVPAKGESTLTYTVHYSW